MEIKIQKIQVFYELAMSIGKSLDLQEMLKHSLLAYLRKLNCIGALVYELSLEENGLYNTEMIFSIPVAIAMKNKYQEILDYIPPSFDDASLDEFRNSLTISGKAEKELSYNIMQLGSFGFLVLIKSKKELEKDTILMLEEINTKLGQACMACRNNKALQENEERYKSMFYTNNSIMLLIDSKNGNIVNANNSAEMFYGYSRKTLQTMNIRDINELPDNELSKSLADAYSGKRTSFLFEHKLANNEIRNVQVSCSTIIYKDHTFLYSIIYDVTKQLKAEKELLEAKEKAEESDRLKSAFLANVSHEIRTPMNGIIGFSEIIMAGDISTEKRNYFSKLVIKNSHQLLSIVNDILDISLIESGNLKLRYEKVNINELILDTYSMFIHQAESKNIDLFCENNLDDKDCFFECDRSRFNQILTNLIHNALKFTEKGHIKIAYKQIDKMIQFSIEDTGIGIENDQLDLIFERFRQEENELTKKYGGTGLGLSISKKLVGLLEGDIWVVSKKGKGSVFYFTIPCTQTTK